MQFRKALFVFLILFACFQKRVSAQDNDNYPRRKYVEIRALYNQLNKGYIEGGVALFRNVDFAYSGFWEHTLNAGYNPWRNALIVESDQRFDLFILAFGIGIGYCQNLSASNNAWFYRPEAGLDFKLFSIFYSYSYVEHNTALFTPEHNITLSLTIRSSDYFFRHKSAEFNWWNRYR